MSQEPIPSNEPQRLAALKRYEVLNSLAEDEFDRITELASLICGMPISLVSFIDEDRQWFKSKVGLEISEIPRQLAFCKYTIMGNELLEVSDATKDVRFKENILVTGEAGVRFYAGFPLIDQEGFALGTVCVIDRVPNELSEKQRRIMELLAEEVMVLIVERRQKEELRNFQKLFDYSSDMICIANDEGYFRKVNPAFERILGWQADKLLNQFVMDFIHPDDLAEAREELEKLQNGQPTINFISRYRTSRNDYRTLQWTVTPEQATGNLFAIARDITQVMEQHEELTAAKSQAEQASIAKSEFLANMSHEIRTPLNGVIGFTDLLLKTSLSEIQQQYLTIVNQSANALLSIINDILDFSKIEAGKLELEIERYDLYQLGAEATDMITYQIQTKGLEMLLNISPELPRFVWADTLRLKQVLINLLSNATKFTESGEIELKITPVNTGIGHDIIRFSVRDTGVGIQPEMQQKVFDAFSQEDGSTTKRYGGTGLGLTISNKLLAMMGTRLQLDSVPGNGSTFFFDIKLRSERGQPEVWENLDLVKDVLIVDDNENNRTILRQMLLLENIQSKEVKNGFDALAELAAGARFDLILMDYHMPDMDGLETIRKIRNTFYPTAADQQIMLLYSSSDDERVIRTCEELQVNQRLVKPIKIKDLFTSLSRLYKKAPPVRKTLASKPGLDYAQHEPIILVAEDNKVNMLLARTIVRRLLPNAILMEAENGAEAIALCKQKMPDLILMDIQMPKVNGYQASLQIRDLEGGKDVPIIALTAGNVKSERENAKAAGMDDFVVKPIVEEMIAVMLKKWLAERPNDLHANVKLKIIDLPNFDIDQLKIIYGEDNDVLIRDVIELTRIELKESLKMITALVLAKDLKALKQFGHKLHGTAVSAGLSNLAQMASKLETVEERNIDQIIELYENIQSEINLLEHRLIDYLEHHLKT